VITDVLFDARREIEDYVRGGFYDAPEGPEHEAIAHLAAHMTAVQEAFEYARDKNAALDDVARQFGTVSKRRMAAYVSRVTSPVDA
jgi:hypothetical protein